MGRVVYYLPERREPDAAALEAAGLTGVLPVGKRAWRQVSRGPDGGAGLIVCATAAGYYPERQAWSESPLDADSWWIGIEGSVTPDDLVRDETLQGLPLRLADGNEWVVPLVLKDGSSDHLPGITKVDGAGEPFTRPDPQWDPLRTAAARVEQVALALDVETDVDAGEVTYRELFDIAVLALSTNYRVGRVEAHELELLSKELVGCVCAALSDKTALGAVRESRSSLAPRAASSAREGDDGDG